MLYLLLVVYQLKHFICDYPLQNKYMLGKFLPYPRFILPLLAHSGIHSLFTFLICCTFGVEKALVLALFDGIIHFIVDRIKASPSLGGRFKALNKSTYIQAENMAKGLTSNGEEIPFNIDDQIRETYKQLGKDDLKSNMYFWWSLGADQMAHHLTHYFIIWSVLK